MKTYGWFGKIRVFFLGRVCMFGMFAGLLSCAIPVEIPDESTLEVSITGVPAALLEGNTFLASVSVGDYAGNFGIVWFMDGLTVAETDQTQTSMEFGESLAAGSHELAVEVTSSDGKSRGTSSRAFSVTEAGGVIMGIDVDETNTGVPPGRVLIDVPSSIVVTEAWIASSNGGRRVLEDRNFLSGASLRLEVSDFTVRYCRFNGVGGITLAKGNSGNLIQDCELDGNHENLGDRVAIMNEGVRIIRVHVRRWPRALWTGQGDIYVENCYFHDLTADNSGKHIENVYVAGGRNQTYLRNKFISNRCSINGGRGAISASLAIYNESWASFPALDSILVEGNYFETNGGFAMYGGALSNKGAPYPTNMIVRDNVFGRGLQRLCGVYGPVTAFDEKRTGNLWQNNTWGPRGPYWVAGDPEEGDPIASPGVR